MGLRLKRCSCGNILESDKKYCSLCKKDILKDSVKVKNRLLKDLIQSLYKKVSYEK